MEGTLNYMYNYKFSIIIPIYNSERYLDETIKSIVNQTIGFENIQLILINDGSKDNSEDICFKYIEKNLNNIIYIKQENKGQSFARNVGYKYIEGEYVNFLDSDDKLEKDGLEKVYNYFNDNEGQFNLVVIPRKFFEKLDYVMESYQKYTQNSIVDILKDVDRREGGVGNVFFKNKLIKKYSFDSNCLLIEDFKLIYTILTVEQKYGYLSSTYYLYRIRDTGDSVSNSITKNKFNYTERIKIVYIYMIKLSIKIYGEVILFLQNAIFGNLISAFLSEKLYLDDCSKDEKKQFFEDLKVVISSIDDEFILQNVTLGYQIYGLFLLNFKYKEQYISNNKININNLINKKILVNNIELYCFLNYM